MYPVLRTFKELWMARNASELPLTGTHVSHHMCWPWDLDMWIELNNGRTLTLFDLGRITLAKRTGITRVLFQNKWGLTMAGASVRYRRRIRMFDRFEMRSRAIAWDARFVYLEQSMWRRGECANHVLFRSAVTSPDGIVPPQKVIEALGLDMPSPPIPDWVQAWIDADNERPWPPMDESPED